MIDINEIANISGLTNKKVLTFLPGVLQTIRNYTHKPEIFAISFISIIYITSV